MGRGSSRSPSAGSDAGSDMLARGRASTHTTTTSDKHSNIYFPSAYGRSEVYIIRVVPTRNTGSFNFGTPPPPDGSKPAARAGARLGARCKPLMFMQIYKTARTRVQLQPHICSGLYIYTVVVHGTGMFRTTATSSVGVRLPVSCHLAEDQCVYKRVALSNFLY